MVYNKKRLIYNIVLLLSLLIIYEYFTTPFNVENTSLEYVLTKHTNDHSYALYTLVDVNYEPASYYTLNRRILDDLRDNFIIYWIKKKKNRNERSIRKTKNCFSINTL